MKTIPEIIGSLIPVMLLCPLLWGDEFSESVRLDNFSPAIYRQQEVTYALSSSHRDFSLTETPFQKVISTTRKKGTTIVIQCGISNPEAAASNDPGRYLVNTRFLRIHDKSIINASRTISPDHDPVKAVEDFVNRHITKKITGIPLVQAPGILKHRTGDCTEHTVLAVALLRARKIPARAVVGMVLAREYGSLRNVFVYHMWAEALINKSWVLVDATAPGKKRHERYIAFAYHSLKTETPLAYLKTIAAIKNLTLRYVR